MSRGSKMSKTRSTASKALTKKSKMSSTGSKAAKSKAKKAEEDEDLPEVMYSHNYEVLTRIFSMKGRLIAGPEGHSNLLAAVHFAVRFFASTLEIANQTAQRLASMPPEEENQDEEAAKAARLEAAMGGPKEVVVVALMPSFVLPEHLASWADEARWPWASSQALTTLLGRAREMEVVFDSSGTWAGHPDAFARPTISFHAQSRLLDDLEEHCYHLWAFPVLALQLQLAKAFESPIGEAVACLAYMRLSRLAAACRLTGPAAQAREKWVEALKEIPATLGSFEAQREQVRSKRAGAKGANGPDPDWLDSKVGGQTPEGRVSAPWVCTDLQAYEVWAALSKECVKHGELWMASTLLVEAAQHASDYGDGRTIRELHITKAQLAYEEGKDAEVIGILKDITAAEPMQAVQVAILLAHAYGRSRQQNLADEVLGDARKAIHAAAWRLRSGAPDEVASRHVMMDCIIRNAQVRSEIARLSASPVASDAWLDDLDATLEAFQEIAEKLIAGAFYRCCVEACRDFVEAVLTMLEGKQLDLARDPDNQLLTYGILEERCEQLCGSVAACGAAKEAMVRRAVPVEGVDGDAVVPAEVLAAELDVWEARSRAACRRFGERKARDAKRKAEVTKTLKLGASDAAGHFSGVGGLSKASALPPDPEPAEHLDAWLEDAAGKIAHSDNVKTVARELLQVEASIGSVSNAVTVMQLHGGRDPAAADAEEGSFPVPACRVQALAELGCLQLELARRTSPEAFARKWDAPSADLSEVKAMACAERLSQVLQNKDPNALFGPRRPEAEAGGAEPSSLSTLAEPEAEELPYEELAKATLCEAARAALQSRRFGAARHALEALALEAYGQSCPQAAAEFLFWLQTTDVCMVAEELFEELLPPDHLERVQRRMLRKMEQSWPTPEGLSSYQATKQRLEQESPLFQRLCPAALPPVCDLLLTSVPPLTLVVTLQVHNNAIYVGAASSPPNSVADPKAPPPSREDRLAQMQWMALRIEVPESELMACVNKLRELNAFLEKDLVTIPELDASTLEQFEKVVAELESFFVAPLAEELATHFWPNSTHGAHPLNPTQCMILPDRMLWGVPFERMHSLVGLFGGASSYSALGRDLSLHLMAQRTPDPEKQPPRPASTVLLTDAFNEDALRPTDNPKSETFGKLHKRLVDNKTISGGDKSIHGGALVASPEDVKRMLADSTLFLALGFGRFWATMPSGPFASLDLRHIKLVALFHRGVNDKAFRRQTKSDSAKTPRQLSFEDAYCSALIAAFRGVQCMVQPAGPTPAPMLMRTMETFAKALQGGKTVAKALEEVLQLQVDAAELRYQRSLEGGALPPAPAGGEKEALLPLHTRTVFGSVGPPWSPLDDGGAAGGKKK